MWRKLTDFMAEKKAQNPVTSLAVMLFSVPIRGSLGMLWLLVKINLQVNWNATCQVFPDCLKVLTGQAHLLKLFTASSSTKWGRGGGWCLFNCRGGGGVPGGEGLGRGAGRVSEGNFGGGRPNILFRGRNSRQVSQLESAVCKLVALWKVRLRSIFLAS